MNIGNYIPDDGYTQNGYIAAVAGLHDAVRFTFRPTLYGQRLALQTRLAALSGQHAADFVAKAVARQVKDWDVKDAQGKPLPVDAKYAVRLRPALLDRLYTIVCGYSASDIDQENAEPTGDVDIEALFAESTPGDMQQDADEKN